MRYLPNITNKKKQNCYTYFFLLMLLTWTLQVLAGGDDDNIQFNKQTNIDALFNQKANIDAFCHWLLIDSIPNTLFYLTTPIAIGDLYKNPKKYYEDYDVLHFPTLGSVSIFFRDSSLPFVIDFEKETITTKKKDCPEIKFTPYNLTDNIQELPPSIQPIAQFRLKQLSHGYTNLLRKVDQSKQKTKNYKEKFAKALDENQKKMEELNQSNKARLSQESNKNKGWKTRLEIAKQKKEKLNKLCLRQRVQLKDAKKCLGSQRAQIDFLTKERNAYQLAAKNTNQRQQTTPESTVVSLNHKLHSLEPDTPPTDPHDISLDKHLGKIVEKTNSSKTSSADNDDEIASNSLATRQCEKRHEHTKTIPKKSVASEKVRTKKKNNNKKYQQIPNDSSDIDVMAAYIENDGTLAKLPKEKRDYGHVILSLLSRNLIAAGGGSKKLARYTKTAGIQAVRPLCWLLTYLRSSPHLLQIAISSLFSVAISKAVITHILQPRHNPFIVINGSMLGLLTTLNCQNLCSHFFNISLSCKQALGFLVSYAITSLILIYTHTEDINVQEEITHAFKEFFTPEQIIMGLSTTMLPAAVIFKAGLNNILRAQRDIASDQEKSEESNKPNSIQCQRKAASRAGFSSKKELTLICAAIWAATSAAMLMLNIFLATG